MLAATPSFARRASDVRDLVGARGHSGESELENRGFIHIMMHEGSQYAKYSYWWNAQSKTCIQVETYDGRYANISDAMKSDCHQRYNNS
ncbi:MAG: hypothetical protein ACRCS9_15250 [Hyphomicrobium sp.]